MRVAVNGAHQFMRRQTTPHLVKLGPTPRPAGTERLHDALNAVDRAAKLSDTLSGWIKGAFNRACVAYADGHIEIAFHELTTLYLWLEQALDSVSGAVNAGAFTLSEAERATVRLRRLWRKQWERQQLAALQAEISR
jgi:hypothetical protein